MNEYAFFQAMSTRWPSWAPKDEFYGAKLSYLTQYLPSTGFSTLFRKLSQSWSPQCQISFIPSPETQFQCQKNCAGKQRTAQSRVNIGVKAMIWQGSFRSFSVTTPNFLFNLRAKTALKLTDLQRWISFYDWDFLQADERSHLCPDYWERCAGHVSKVARHYFLSRVGLLQNHLQQGLLRPRIVRVHRGCRRTQVGVPIEFLNKETGFLAALVFGLNI